MTNRITTLMLIFLMQGCFYYQGESYYSAEITPKRSNMDWEVIENVLYLTIYRNTKNDYFEIDLNAPENSRWYNENGSLRKIKSLKVVGDNIKFNRCRVNYNVRRNRHGYND